jgi:hypothetical protein
VGAECLGLWTQQWRHREARSCDGGVLRRDVAAECGLMGRRAQGSVGGCDGRRGEAASGEHV